MGKNYYSRLTTCQLWSSFEVLFSFKNNFVGKVGLNAIKSFQNKCKKKYILVKIQEKSLVAWEKVNKKQLNIDKKLFAVGKVHLNIIRPSS